MFKSLIVALPLVAIALPAAAQWPSPAMPGYAWGEHERREEWRERERRHEMWREEHERQRAWWCTHHPYECR